MTSRALAISSAALLVACSSGDFDTAPLPADAAGETATIDASSPDASSPDASAADSSAADGSPADGSADAAPDTRVADGGAPDARPEDECKLASDCRLFSSDCNDALCVCFALSNVAPDPACTSGHGTCFVDPCQGKAAKCMAGKCTVE